VVDFPPHSPKRIEFIQQKSRRGCGIACFAMLVGLLYDDARTYFNRVSDGMYPDDLLEALGGIGLEAEEVKRLPRKRAALVALQWKDESLGGHYVVWDPHRRQFLDPLHGLVERNDMLECADVDHIWAVEAVLPMKE
jgi:hypothetical protein